VLRNVPSIRDVHIVCEMIRRLGGHATLTESGDVEISAGEPGTLAAADWAEFAGQSRIPILFCGPLLARLGAAMIAPLGGDAIGPRPVDFHIAALRHFGATVEDRGADGLLLRAPKLAGCKITLDYPSVGATEQVLLTAVLAEGITELSNAAVEPEIIDLIMLLQKMGAVISVDTDRVITITGVGSLRGFVHTAMPDPLEAASWACAAVATGGDILVRNARQMDLMTFLNKFRQLGGEFEALDHGIRFTRAASVLQPVVIETDVYPGFRTDWQQPFVVALTQAAGVSIVHETVYEDRFGYTAALNRMGANIQLHRECLGGKRCRFGQRNHLHSAVIAGPTPLHGADVYVPDLRAGFSYVVAALAAEGRSTVGNMQLIRRGYEDLPLKLQSLGAHVQF
jgi:UDP-N-acetylglucosamine 1-carboxyvinyltransferase